ncbi:hypothetical protein AnigIFM56816_010339 [Aspergillus niger]|nr:hypothetical protein AnigIFM56816_010339 [Aspergillus niger]
MDVVIEATCFDEENVMGECNEAQTFALLGAIYDEYLADCASVNVYQYEESETWIGEWLEKGGNREQLVYIVYHLLLLQLQVPTKYKTRNSRDNQSNLGGNLLKSMHVSVEKRLKKLQTDYIDILKVLWWDSTTSVEEAMRGLDSLITSGKAVLRANDYARANALRLVLVYQGNWNAGDRDMERVGITGWKLRREDRRVAGSLKLLSREWSPKGVRGGKIPDALKRIVEKMGVRLHAVVLSYVMHIILHVFPTAEQRNVEQFNVIFKTSSEELVEVDSTEDSDVEFPMDFIFEKYKISTTASDVFLAPEDC